MENHIPCHKLKLAIKILPSEFISYIIRGVQTTLSYMILPNQSPIFLKGDSDSEPPLVEL